MSLIESRIVLWLAEAAGKQVLSAGAKAVYVRMGITDESDKHYEKLYGAINAQHTLIEQLQRDIQNVAQKVNEDRLSVLRSAFEHLSYTKAVPNREMYFALTIDGFRKTSALPRPRPH